MKYKKIHIHTRIYKLNERYINPGNARSSVYNSSRFVVYIMDEHCRAGPPSHHHHHPCARGQFARLKIIDFRSRRWRARVPVELLRAYSGPPAGVDEFQFSSDRVERERRSRFYRRLGQTPIGYIGYITLVQAGPKRAVIAFLIRPSGLGFVVRVGVEFVRYFVFLLSMGSGGGTLIRNAYRYVTTPPNTVRGRVTYRITRQFRNQTFTVSRSV